MGLIEIFAVVIAIICLLLYAFIDCIKGSFGFIELLLNVVYGIFVYGGIAAGVIVVVVGMIDMLSEKENSDAGGTVLVGCVLLFLCGGIHLGLKWLEAAL